MTTIEAIKLVQERADEIMSNVDMQLHLMKLAEKKGFTNGELQEYVRLAAIASLFGADITQSPKIKNNKIRYPK